MSLIADLRARGFVHQTTDETALDAALGAGEVAYYCGFDPTAPSLHVGSAVQLMLMGHLARAGHRTIAVIGGGTGMVGDPSGRDSTRDFITPEFVRANLDGIRPQIQGFAPNATLVDNAEWLLPLQYIPFLRDIGRHFSVNRMLGADSVRLRLERDQGISFIEFNYCLLQAYDFLELNRRFGCCLQVGGADQWFNILMGVELIRRIESKESWGLTTPLLTTATGAKMGKTAAGAVWLDPTRTSPFDFYQYWYNSDDRDLGPFLKLFTYLDLRRIDEILAGDVREAKHHLAREVTAQVHGGPVADETARRVKETFSQGFSEAMPVHRVPAFPASVVDVLVGSGLCGGKGEARRLIDGGGVRFGDEKILDPTWCVPSPGVLWAGKKRAVRVEG